MNHILPSLFIVAMFAAPLFFSWTGDQKESALYTMYNVIGIGGINHDDPLKSRLITKPLEKNYTVQTDYGNITGMEHGGGPKFKPDSLGSFKDQAFYDYLKWITYYADCYKSK